MSVLDRATRRHRRMARKFYRTPLTIERSTPTGWEAIPGEHRGNIQYRFAFGSHPDPDYATPADTESATLYIDPTTPLALGDRITNLTTGTIMHVVAVNDEATDLGSMEVSLLRTALATVGEEITVRRHMGAGVMADVGSFLVQFTENPSVAGTGVTASGSTTDGTILAPAAASVVIPGDYFDRAGSPGVIIDTDTDQATGSITLRYRMEEAG